MRKLLYVTLFCASVAVAQSITYRGGLDAMQGGYLVDFLPDGGLTTTVTCSAIGAPLTDGGVWPLRFAEAGPITRIMPNAALNVCRNVLLGRNGIDGGNIDGGN